MRTAKLRKPPSQLLHILAMAYRSLCHAARPPALDTTYQPSLTAVTHAHRKLTVFTEFMLIAAISAPKIEYSKPQALKIIRFTRYFLAITPKPNAGYSASTNGPTTYRIEP